MRTRLLALAAAAAGLLTAFVSQAQPWPSKPVRLVVPFSAGGSTDVVARIVGEKLASRLGGTVLVDNKPGAGGALGSEAVAKSAADGYTFLVGTASTMVIGPHIYTKPRYDALHDFASVTLLGIADIVIVVNSGLPFRSVKDLVQYAKANPGKLTFASAGNGSISHLLGEYFKSMAKVELVHVPYRGDAQVVPDLIAGQVSMSFGTAVGYMPHMRSGKIVAIAVTNPRRSTTLTDLPTVSESGVPGYEAVQWFGVSAPRGTPAEIVNRMSAEIRAILAMPEVAKRCAELGFDVAGTSPEEYERFIRSEDTKWKKIVELSGTKLD
ncbi:MAG: tripartite tricarboxylate transporter substrate binding protein [Rhodocyclaceae bacterium]|nr:tripartite tricarboxylate transporter substrate binding protein [Rhodocyclaceae bacterium]